MNSASTISAREAELFEKWSGQRERFSPDGIIYESSYLASDPKIMLILNETNSNEQESVDLRQFLRNGAYDRTQTWDNVTRWVHGIRNIDRDITWVELNDRKELDQWRNELLPSICVINVKKSSGTHTANNKELRTVAAEDKHLLKEQFDLYNSDEHLRPRFVIGCGSICSNIFCEFVLNDHKDDWQRTSRGVWYFPFNEGRSHYILYAHPEARVADHILYYGLVDAVKEIANVQGYR